MGVDEFYTRPDVAEKLCSGLAFDLFDTVIEPSAGSGNFLPFIPQNVVAMDINPQSPLVERKDFFDYHPIRGNILVIGNPPFGVQGNLAVKFFNHAATFAECIAMIFPATFQKIRIKNRLDLNFRVKSNKQISEGSFYPSSMKARCVFQVWGRSARPRKRVIAPPTTDFWREPQESSDIAIKAAGGSGDCGTIILPREVSNPKAYHFLGVKNKRVINRLKKLAYYPTASWAVRQDSISLDEIKILYTGALK